LGKPQQRCGTGLETPKATTPASTFHIANAPKTDAEGVKRLYLRINVDVVVSSHQHGSSALMLLTRRLLNEQPSYFHAAFTPATDFTGVQV